MSESIYNLVPRDYVVPEKEPMYRSIHDPNKLLTGSTFGCRGTTRLPGAGTTLPKAGATFGPPTHVTLTSTMKKTLEEAAIRTRGDIDSYQTKYASKVKTSLPSKDDLPVMGIRSNKNFITSNAVEAILQVPRSVEAADLNYLKKEDYGKTPSYLTKVKEEIRRENEMIDKYVKEQLGEVEREPEQFEQMSQYERQDLIQALKNKWDAVNAKYQKITHLVRLDTTGQIRRKEQLENELQTIERDIEKLSRHSTILIREG